MASSELLSQDEIEALTRGVEQGAIDTSSEECGEDNVCAFDFGRQQSLSTASLPMLELINERFARAFRRSLFDILFCDAQITVTGVQSLRYSDYLHSLPVPTSLNHVSMRPLPGKALCVMDADLVFHAVDIFFGGNGDNAKYERRDFSPGEARVTRIILERVMPDLMHAWKPVISLETEFQAMQADPYLANIERTTEQVLVCGFHVSMAGTGGDFSIVLPYSLLKPLHNRLRSVAQPEYSQPGTEWMSTLHEDIRTAEVNLSCRLPQTEMSLGEVLGLKVGDVISLDSADQVSVMAEDVPLFAGKYGNYRGRQAVKLQHRIQTSTSRAEHEALDAGAMHEQDRNQ